MKHHYIPEFYSKQWATGEDRKVLRYRRLTTGKVVAKRLAPAAIGYREDLYRAPYPEYERAHALELKFFSKLDDMAAKALTELTKTGISELPPRAVRVWHHFVLSLLHRSPAYFDSVRRAGHEHYERALEDARERYPELRAPTDPPTFDEYVRTVDEQTISRSILSSLPALIFSRRILGFMATMTWFTLAWLPDCPTLLLSDDPLARTNGVKRYDGHFAIPLSPWKLLVGTATEDFAGHIQSMRRKEAFAATNRMTVEGAREFVAAIDDSQARFVANRFGAAPRSALAGNQ